MKAGGFPSFGGYETGTYVSALKNYNLPQVILEKVAKECNSDLQRKGKIEDRLQSMNNAALEKLHKIFVACEDDSSGQYANYRFCAYISSMFHKCEILLDDKIQGASGKTHKIPVAVKNNGMYIAVGFNKSYGKPVTKREAKKFYEIVDDIKRGEHGTQLADGVYGTSVGFEGEALVTLENLGKERKKDPANRIDFKAAIFEDKIYSVTKY